MKRIHYLLLGLLVSLTIAAVSPSSPPTRIIAGSGVTVVTNSAASFTISASGCVGTSNGFATNLSVYSSGGTNYSWRAYGTNNSTEVFVDKDALLNVQKVKTATASWLTPVVYGASSTYGLGFSSGSLNIIANSQEVAAGLYSNLDAAGNVGFLAATHMLLSGSSSAPSGTGPSGGAVIQWIAPGVTGFKYSTAVQAVRVYNSGTTYLNLTNGMVVFPQITTPANPAANYAQIYAKDVAGTAEVFVMDEAGNETQISPHARASSPAPASVDAGLRTPIVIHHRNVYTGEEEWLHLSAMARKLEQITGEKFVWSRAVPRGEQRDWEADQEAQQQLYDRERAAELATLIKWQGNPESSRGVAPTVRPARQVKKPRPDFLKTSP